MLGQDTTDVLAFACVNVEVYATLRFIERNAYKSFGIDYSFHHSCFLLSANIHHSFIKMAFDKIQQVGDISPTVVAGGMKVALITTIFGLIVALILQVFYNYILSKIEALTSEMEDSSISLLDMVIKYDLKYKK